MRKESTKKRLPRTLITLYHEEKARRSGFRHIAGIDEAGRGPLAGPVVACSVILKERHFKNRIDDSKRLTPKARLIAYKEIARKAIFGIGIVSEKIIDRINIRNATIMAMEKATKKLSVKPDFLLIDGRAPIRFPCKKSYIVNGDARVLSIACASIIAKVTRDNIMQKYHKKYPKYGFQQHKGYGTKAHIHNIRKHGPSPIHRTTFSPIKQLT